LSFVVDLVRRRCLCTARDAVVLAIIAIICVTSIAAAIISPPRPTSGVAYAASGAVRIGLLVGGNTVSAGANCAYTVVDLRTGAKVADGAARSEISYRLSGAAIQAGSYGSYAVLGIRPSSQGGFVTVAGVPYRGTLEIRVGSDGKLLVVNEVELESYLRGVVPREMISSWPLEALKAQAVAARTYAVAKVAECAASGAYYAMTATTNSQVYGGVNAETANSDAAVAATAGLILTYGGKTITAYYHASSGGHTENSENVWTASVPYLRGVPDFDQLAPKYSWTRSMTPAEVTYRLAEAGYNIGAVTAIEPEGPLGVSGRWVRVKFTGTSGSPIILKGEQARVILGLYSTLFDVAFAGEGVADLVTHVSYGSEVIVAGGSAGQIVTAARKGGTNYSIGVEGVLYRMDSPAVLYRADVKGRVDFVGHGWGHGVGMSQWGAYQMAKDGKTFSEILLHYYQGAVLEAR